MDQPSSGRRRTMAGPSAVGLSCFRVHSCAFAVPIREALLFRQHEIADNGSEIATTGDELS
jgi:hypothetical protein